MTDTIRTKTELQALLADNTSGAISAQDLRDFLVSAQPGTGRIYQVNNASATTVSLANTYYEATLSGTTLTTTHDYDSPASGRIRYTGTKTRQGFLLATVSFTVNGTNDVIYLDIAKNGTPSGTAEIHRKVGTGTDVGAVSINYATSFAQNDYFSLYVKNATAADDVTIETFNLMAVDFLE